MEKFTVDLDKVLDEFEFNEEQAIRHALQHFKREDLPATKYQKPHFRPINIADADFGPCIETTMSYSDYPHGEAPEENESSAVSLGANDLQCPDIAEAPKADSFRQDVISDEKKSTVLDEEISDSYENKSTVVEEKEINLKESMTVELEEQNINFEKSEPMVSEHQDNDLREGKSVLINKEIMIDKVKDKCKNVMNVNEYIAKDETKSSISVDLKESQIEQIEVKVVPTEKKEEVIENSQQKKKEIVNVEVKEEGSEPYEVKVIETEQNETKLGEVERKEVKVEESKEIEIVENNVGSEKKDKIDVAIESQSVETVLVGKEVIGPKTKKVESELPGSMEAVLENPQSKKKNSEKNDQIKSADLVTKNEPKEELKSEPEAESESKLETTSELLVTDEQTSPVRVPVEEVKLDKTNIKPIQFESQLDITEEELEKYLEELEEEEAKEVKKKSEEGESKPPRPDTLDLDQLGQPGSPGQTPLPKTTDGDEGAKVSEDNCKNEEMEEIAKAESKYILDSLCEIEALLDEKPEEDNLSVGERRLGKVSPFWMPDHLASSCMECESKFTVIKRRHHCRACGRILCSKCCGMRASLEYLQNQEQRVCETCFRTLAKVMMYELQNGSAVEPSPRRRPNPNNPMEYCSTVPPPLQVSSASTQPPPSVMVPVGVLKREGSSKIKETPKQVMFSDGVRPGGDLTELDGSGDHRNTFRKSGRSTKRAGTPPGNSSLSPSVMLPPVDPASQSFIVDKGLPPVCVVSKGETTYEENWPLTKIMERLKDPESPPLLFAINRNLVASVKIVKLDCCMKETCWVICSKGMGCVGQDEIIVLLTLNGENDDQLPKEVLLQFHYIYKEAARGNTVNELGYWCVKESSFLDSKQHGGFLFIRPTFQCLNRIETPPPPFLVGVLIHRSEIPWARVFPFRLMLRLGAEFRYYPCPLVSVRFREPVYYEIGHTIINLLADFRNLSYTIPSVRGLRIHMEANQTSILIPRNRYDQVVRALNNSNDPVLALAGNFSPEADAHLVCMQSKGNEVTYSTHAININDKPRKVTGASFVVLNGALKTTSGVAAKSNIVEDGLMVQVPSETMTALRTKLRNMEDWSVQCGPIEGRNAEEVVRIIWCEDDKNFNVGVKSVIDNMPLDGVPSIRVHSGKDYMGCTKFIRWTQVFIIKCEDGATSAKIGDPLEVNKLSESIARATCIALSKLLELLAASGLTVLAVRATVDQENVGYEAGSNGEKLAPIYMNSLDNELIPVLHKAVSVNDSVAVLELIFHIMDQ